MMSGSAGAAWQSMRACSATLSMERGAFRLAAILISGQDWRGPAAHPWFPDRDLDAWLDIGPPSVLLAVLLPNDPNCLLQTRQGEISKEREEGEREREGSGRGVRKHPLTQLTISLLTVPHSSSFQSRCRYQTRAHPPEQTHVTTLCSSAGRLARLMSPECGPTGLALASMQCIRSNH